MVLAHLLQDLDEEADLDLGSLLEQGIEGSSALGLAQDPKPLFNSTEFVLEVLIEGCSSHLLQRGLVLVNVGDPLLSQLVLGVDLGIALTLTLSGLAVEVGRGTDRAIGRLREGRDVGRGPGKTAADGARLRGPQRDMASLRGAIAVAHDVRHGDHSPVNDVRTGGRDLVVEDWPE